MLGVRNVYTCAYNESGKSLSDLVNQYNSSLDNRIKVAMNNSIHSFEAFRKPFGVAIWEEQTQLKNTQQSIIKLQSLLEEELLQLINEKIKQ